MPTIINKSELVAANTKSNASVQASEDKLNVLKRFRSYSYHHVLIAANTTIAAAEVVDNRTDIMGFMHPSTNEKRKYEAIPSKSGNGSYVVLINGMTDAQYLINSIEWEAIFDPDARSSNPHATFVEGTMEIVEPKGVRFMRIMKEACDSLKTDPNGLTFVLKTIFVGYDDDDAGGQVSQIIDVKPFQFFIYDITGEFTNSGSSYHISFVGQVNGTSRLPAFSTVQQANVSGGTIKEAVSSLQDRMNTAAKEAHAQLIKQLDERNSEKVEAAGKEKSPQGRYVEYEINVHADFQNLPLDNTHIRNQTVAAKSQLGTPTGIDIESAISDIMYCSTGIVEMMKQDATDGKGYRTIFKIESAMVSDLEKLKMVYSVKKCRVPVITKDNRSHAGTIVQPDITTREVMQFDYLYTGNNTEVLEYDMKMAMGLAFFQTIGSSNNLPAKSNSASGNHTTLSNGQGTVLNDKSVGMRELTPVPPPSSITDPAAQNKVEPAKTADYRTFMARQAMLESVEAKLRIVGIPALLEGFNLTPEDVANPAINAQKEQLPLVKVRVRMPTEDFGGADAEYAEDFWYEGFFYIISCKNVFRDGRFEQELDLISLMYEELVTPSSSKAAPTKGSSGGSRGSVGNGPSTGKKGETNPVESNTAEQKVKNGSAPVKLTEQEELNCQTVKKMPRPFTEEVAKRTKLSPSFSLLTLTRKPDNYRNVDDRILGNLCALAKKLEEVQNLLGRRITITSGYRSPAYNAKVGGASKTSDHMRGVAADIQVAGMAARTVYETLKSSGMDFRQVIYERSGSSQWVHVSFNIDPSLAAVSKKFFEMVV